jgi:hypothetical protein
MDTLQFLAESRGSNKISKLFYDRCVDVLRPAYFAPFQDSQDLSRYPELLEGCHPSVPRPKAEAGPDYCPDVACYNFMPCYHNRLCVSVQPLQANGCIATCIACSMMERVRGALQHFPSEVSGIIVKFLDELKHVTVQRLMQEFAIEVLHEETELLTTREQRAEFEASSTTNEAHLADVLQRYREIAPAERADLIENAAEMLESIVAWYTLRSADEAFCRLPWAQQADRFLRFMPSFSSDVQCKTDYAAYVSLRFQELLVGHVYDDSIRDELWQVFECADFEVLARKELVPCEMILYRTNTYCFRPYVV